MKTLSNCKPREFMRQLSRIRQATREWMDLTQLQQLRRRMPPQMDYKDDDERISAIMAQWRTNIRDMVDAALIEHPDETIELLGLLCFIEPQALDDYKMSDLYAGFLETLKDDQMLDFFTLMLSLFTPRIMVTSSAAAATPATATAATAATPAAADAELTRA